jgi:hypothetical protein
MATRGSFGWLCFGLSDLSGLIRLKSIAVVSDLTAWRHAALTHNSLQCIAQLRRQFALEKYTNSDGHTQVLYLVHVFDNPAVLILITIEPSMSKCK